MTISEITAIHKKAKRRLNACQSNAHSMIHQDTIDLCEELTAAKIEISQLKAQIEGLLK